MFAPRIMLCRKARRQSQYFQRPLEAWSDDKIDVFKSQKDQETERPKQNEPEIGRDSPVVSPADTSDSDRSS